MKEINITDLEENAKNIIKNDIVSFMDWLIANPTMSAYSLLYLMQIATTPEPVYGIAAWTALKRTINSESNPLSLVYPAIITIDRGITADMTFLERAQHTEFDCHYCLVEAYPYSATNGKEIPKKKIAENIFDRIAELTNTSPEIVSLSYKSNEFGIYDKERNCFYISPSCPKDKEIETLLSMYIDYYLWQTQNEDKLFRVALKYVVFKQFDCEIEVNSVLYRSLYNRNNEDVFHFISLLQRTSWEIVNELSLESTLNFDETAFVNQLIGSDTQDDIYCLADCIFESLSDKHTYLKQELFALQQKILLLPESAYQELFRKRMQRRIFTYPPYRIIYDMRYYHQTKRQRGDIE